MKALFWDLELSPLILATWGIWEQNIPHDHILEDFKIIAVCWQWEGEKKIHSLTWEKTNDKGDSPVLGYSDKKLVTALHKILSEADILIAQNGDSFDLKKFNTRAIYYGLPPLPEKPSVDTLKVARKVFKFTSNKLDFIGKYLGVGGKMETRKGLWMDVIRGNSSALRDMVKYCKVDVIRLRDIYQRLKPYITNHPNRNLFQGTKENCPKCSGRMKRNGFRITRSGKKQMYQCVECGGWATEGKSLATANIR